MALVPVMIVTALFGGIWGVVAYASKGHEAATILGIGLASILFVIAITVALAGALGIIAGLGVLAGRRWADVLATVIAGLHVFNVPFGTALAAYTFYGLWFAEPAPLRAFPQPVSDLQTSP
ncbi:MAG: hypothetical protein JNK82_16450 [Myxococcaceae bacterium]|nr:hypothetical protein [Myxococcaceae bacterium]